VNVKGARVISPETEDRRGVSVRVLRFVMTAAQGLTVLVVEVRASSTSRDDLVDVERTFASSEQIPGLHEASAIAREDSLPNVSALSLL
jgi:hypothetical protein